MRRKVTVEADPTLPPPQTLALAELVAGATVTRAAEAAGVARQTLYRWLEDDFEFQAALNRAKRHLQDTVETRLLALGEKAAGVLEQALDAGDVRAAVAVLRGLGALDGHAPLVGSSDPGQVREQVGVQRALGLA
jgi:hypothetical protein